MCPLFVSRKSSDFIHKYKKYFLFKKISLQTENRIGCPKTFGAPYFLYPFPIGLLLLRFCSQISGILAPFEL